MAKDQVGVIRQYDFSHGPNYTDSAYALTDKELLHAQNLYWDGSLKTIPGAGRYLETTIAGTSHNFTGLYQYLNFRNYTTALVAATDQGSIFYNATGTWSAIRTGMSTNARAFWNWTVFNNTLIGVNGYNVPQKWGGRGTTMTDLGGSPPPFAHYSSHHAVDYLFLAGMQDRPSDINYSDTADAESWPVGNVLVIGRDDNQLITGLQRFGDSTVIFKNASIYQISGASPDDFSIKATPSDVGCVSPQSIVLTDMGIFFWSEGGPALFNGFKTTLLGKRLQRVFSIVNWGQATKIWAAYYPARKQILVAYPTLGQTTPTQMLLLDLYRLADQNQTPPAFWPIVLPTGGAAQVMTSAYDMIAEENSVRRIMMGHSTGHVTTFDNAATTFNGATIIPGFRTGALHLGKPDRVEMVRDITLRAKAQPGQIQVSYAMNGSQSYTTHASTPYSTEVAGAPVSIFGVVAPVVHQKMLEGDGRGQYPVGNILQLDVVATGSTGFELYGFEVGVETTSRREPSSG